MLVELFIDAAAEILKRVDGGIPIKWREWRPIEKEDEMWGGYKADVGEFSITTITPTKLPAFRDKRFAFALRIEKGSQGLTLTSNPEVIHGEAVNIWDIYFLCLTIQVETANPADWSENLHSQLNQLAYRLFTK